jgi:hypothetical protein
MAKEPEAGGPRMTGDAAWKAELDATERRNAATKQKAQEHVTSSAAAAVKRERRLAREESEQLDALNARIAARAADGSRTVRNP